MSRRLPPGVAALCTVQFVDVLGVTVVVTALPAMLADLGASQSAASLVVTGYAMFFGGLLVLGARCGDRFGHRRVLQTGIVLFGLASLVAALAPTVLVLVVGRCLQGAAAAASVPSALRLITAVAVGAGPSRGGAVGAGLSRGGAARTGPSGGHPAGAGLSPGGAARAGPSGGGPAGVDSSGLDPAEDVRRRSLALWSASGAAAGASGFVLGGVVTQWASWRVIFWGTLVLAVLLAVAVRRAVPSGRGDRGQRLDVAGASVLTAAVMALVVGAALLEFARFRLAGAGLVAVGVALVPALVAVERRQRLPLLPGAAVRDGNLRAGTLGSFLNTATTSSTATLVTLHLQGVDRLSSVGAGLLLLPFSLAVVGGAPLAARALRRRTPRAVMALGLALIAVANLALLPFGGAAVVVPFCMVLAGAGIGLSSVAATATGTDVAEDLQGVASGVLNTAAQLGTALGVAAILLVAALSGGSEGPAGGAPAGWAAAALAAAAGVAWFARSRPHMLRPDADGEQVGRDGLQDREPFEHPQRER
jgi:MFS family permease